MTSTTQDLQQLRFPVGEWKDSNESATSEQINHWIEQIEQFPQKLREKTASLSDEQLSWQYRPKGWSIRQVVHHCADSHMNAFIRIKLCMTEEKPSIRPYMEDRWAEMPDYLEMGVNVSLDLIASVHARWVFMLKKLEKEDFDRQYYHPEHDQFFTIVSGISQYAWHCEHHLAHVDIALRNETRYE